MPTRAVLASATPRATAVRDWPTGRLALPRLASGRPGDGQGSTEPHGKKLSPPDYVSPAPGYQGLQWVHIVPKQTLSFYSDMQFSKATFLSLSTLLSVLLLFGMACKQEEPIDDMEPDPAPVAENVEVIPPFAAGEFATRTGNLSEGEPLSELDWAALSNVACFPGTRFVEFEGNQVFYSVTIPQGAELIATVTPLGERKRINLYGYIDFDGSNVPPVTSVTSCEAGYELYVGSPDLTQPGEPQSISFAQAVNRGFTAFIAVSGAQGVTEGEYELRVELQPM